MGNSVGNTRQWAGSPSFLVDGVSGAFLLIPVVPSPPPPPSFPCHLVKTFKFTSKLGKLFSTFLLFFFLSGHAPLLGKF